MLHKESKFYHKIPHPAVVEMADMEKHELFTNWALCQGVELNGVAAHGFPGRGLGIVAIEAAKVCLVRSVEFLT